MTAPPRHIFRLVRRVRTRLWLDILLGLLGRALWASALVLGLGALVHWRLGFPEPVVLALLASAPPLLALFLSLRRRPTRDTAAAAADRWLKADALLLSAWHLSKEPAASAAAPLVLARARRALPGWAAEIRDRRPELRPGLLWPPVLALLAAMPLLALQPVVRAPAPRAAGAGDAPPAPPPRGTSLATLVEELKALGHRRVPGAPAGTAPLVPAPDTGVSADRRGPADSTGQARTGGPDIATGEAKGVTSSVELENAPGAPQASAAAPSRGTGARRDGAGTEPAPPTQSPTRAPGQRTPVALSAIEREGYAPSPAPGGGDELLPGSDPAGGGVAPGGFSADPPRGMERQLGAYGLAERLLVTRFLRLSRKWEDHD